MTTYTTALLQTINNYAGLDDTALEPLMDGCISHINAETGAGLPHFRDDGVNIAGELQVNITDAQEPAFLAGAALMLRAYNEKGPNLGTPGPAVTAIISDPHFTVWSQVFQAALMRLRRTLGVAFTVTEDTSGIE